MRNQDQEAEINLEEAYQKLEQLGEKERKEKAEILKKIERNKKEMEKNQAILDDWEKVKEKVSRGEYIDVDQHSLSLTKSFSAWQMMQNYNQELKNWREVINHRLVMMNNQQSKTNQPTSPPN